MRFRDRVSMFVRGCRDCASPADSDRAAGIPTWCDRSSGGDGRFWEGSRQWAVTLTYMRTRRLIADRYSLVEPLPGSATGSGWRAQDLWSGQLVMITRIPVSDLTDRELARTRHQIVGEVREDSRPRW